jgi:hypothetical protein
VLGRRSSTDPVPGRAPASSASPDAARHQDPVPDAPVPDVAPGDSGTTRTQPHADPPRPRHRHRARRRPDADLIGRVTWPLAAVALLAAVGVRAAERAVRPEEGLLVTDAFLLSGTDGATPSPVLSPDGLAALHVAVYATLTRVFDRHDTLVQAGREFLLIVAIGSALLVWRTARRLGLRVPAGAAAVVLAGLPALLSAAALIDIPAALAVPWLLLAAWLTASGRFTGTAGAVALAATGIATLLAPDVLLLVLAGVAAGLVTGRAALRGRLIVALALVPVLVLVALLLPRWDPQPDAATFGIGNAALTAVAGGFVVIGGLGAWASDRLRVPAIALVATTLGAIVLQGRLSAVVVCLPLAALVTAALGDQLASRLPAGTRRGLRIGAAAALASALIVAGVGLLRLPEEELPARDYAALVGWVEGNLPPDGRVVAPEQVWGELVHAGGDADVVRLPGTAAGGNALAPVLTVVPGDPPDDGLVLARFDRTAGQPLLVVDPSPGAPTPEELARRQSLATALSANPTTRTGPRAASILRSAQVDQRLLSLLAALGAQYGVGIRDFPLSDGEPDEGPLARRALVDAVGGAPLPPGAPATERLLAWLDAQLPPFAPDSVAVTDGGVLISFRYVPAPDALVTRTAP